MPEDMKLMVVRIVGKDYPGILAAAVQIANKKNTYIRMRRGHTDFDQATVILQLVGTPAQFTTVKADMKEALDQLVEEHLRERAKRRGERFDPKDIPEGEKLDVTLSKANDPEYDGDMYPCALRIEALVPDTYIAEFLAEFTKDFSEAGINIIDDQGQPVEPPAAIRHRVMYRNVLRVHVPLEVFKDQENFEKTLAAKARKYGCLRVYVACEDGA